MNSHRTIERTLLPRTCPQLRGGWGKLARPGFYPVWTGGTESSQFFQPHTMKGQAFSVFVERRRSDSISINQLTESA